GRIDRRPCPCGRRRGGDHPHPRCRRDRAGAARGRGHRERPMTDAVFVTGLALHAYHGVMQHEAKGGENFKLDLVPGIDLASGSAWCWTSIWPRRRAPTSSRIPWATTGSSTSRAGRFAPVAIDWSRPRPARSPKPSSTGSRRSCGCGSPCTSRMRRSRRPLPASGVPSYATARTMADHTTAEALVALGGNMGDMRATLDRAIAAFCDGEKVRLLARSSDYRTPPWGVEDQPPFVNLCIAVETSLAPRALLSRAQAVERGLGRERSKERRWGPRPID